MADAEKVAKLEQELAALKLQISQQPKVTTKFVTPSSKLRRFDGEGDLEQWISESERILRQRGLEGPEAADELILHLSGSAYEEVRGEEKATPKEVYELLRGVFGEQQDASELMGLFHRRVQKEGESLIEYSHALNSLAQRIEKLNPDAFTEKDRALRDRFKEGIRQSDSLCSWVKQRVRDYPEKTFKTIRDEACKYSSDLGDKVKKKSRSSQDECEVESVSKDRIGSTDSTNDQIRELARGQAALLQMLQEQQKQQQVLLGHLIKGQGKPINTVRENKGKKGPCHYCHRMGHFWRDCEAYKQAKLQGVVPNFPPPKFQSQSPPVPTRTVAGTGRTSQSGCGQSFSINTGFESELPNELLEKTIGTRPTEIIEIAGREFLGLIDTGSQVTTLSEQGFRQDFVRGYARKEKLWGGLGGVPPRPEKKLNSKVSETNFFR